MILLQLEFLLQLFLASLFGLFMGIDRQMKHKPLGLKTCTIIATASCLLTIVSVQSFHTFASPVYSNMDPMRLAAQIVSGVGFIGAGVILRRNNDVISGLTSAALIWTAAGLGIAIGAGFYLEASAGFLLIMFSINIIPNLIKRIGPASLRTRDVSVKALMHPNQRMTDIIKAIESGSNGNRQIHIRHMKITDTPEGKQQLDLKLNAPEDQYTSEIYYLIKKIDAVITLEVEHL
jgi:putative Mg2+ transporter-C (MgtC) family protein